MSIYVFTHDGLPTGNNTITLGADNDHAAYAQLYHEVRVEWPTTDADDWELYETLPSD